MDAVRSVVQVMENAIANAIEVFKNRVKEKEEELNRLKKAVNAMASDAGLPVVYASIATEAVGSVASLRSDHFYGQGLLTAMRTYLEMRKASGLSAASATDIYEAVKSGGFKFETANELNAKTVVRSSLRKNSSVFHRLPNGEYGLLSWYPNAKAVKPDEDEDEKVTAPKEKSGNAQPEKSESNGNYFSYDEIRAAVDKITGDFRADDVEKALKTAFPSKEVKRGYIPAVIFALKGKGKLKIVAERQGNKSATFCKV